MNDYKELIEWLRLNEDKLGSKQAGQAADAIEELLEGGWRSCIDHIIRADSPCPVCRIEELEDALAQSIQSQTTAERNASTTLKVFYTSIHEVVPREYWKPLDDYMIKNAVKEDT